MTIDLIQVDDWCALYINDEIAYQGHSMTAAQLLDELTSRKGMLEEWSVTRRFYDDAVPGMGVPGQDWGQFPDEMPAELREALNNG